MSSVELTLLDLHGPPSTGLHMGTCPQPPWLWEYDSWIWSQCLANGMGMGEVVQNVPFWPDGERV